MAFLELDNSKIISNGGVDLSVTAQSLASGQSNTLANNAGYDVAMADNGLVQMVATSVYNLGSLNNVMNSNGSRIEISAAASSAPIAAPLTAPAPLPTRRERRQPSRPDPIRCR
jgi:hypothetical protein